jgi:1,4-alpha-glucan branching enzyme
MMSASLKSFASDQREGFKPQGRPNQAALSFSMGAALQKRNNEIAALAIKEQWTSWSCVSSFDHLVGAGEQSRRNFQAESFGGCQIDDEIEFSRLLDRNIS